jgi:hypothetical protein
VLVSVFLLRGFDDGAVDQGTEQEGRAPLHRLADCSRDLEDNQLGLLRLGLGRPTTHRCSIQTATALIGRRSTLSRVKWTGLPFFVYWMIQGVSRHSSVLLSSAKDRVPVRALVEAAGASCSSKDRRGAGKGVS